MNIKKKYDKIKLNIIQKIGRLELSRHVSIHN